MDVIPTSSLDSFLIGTDGAIDLLGLEEVCLPGKTECVGSISQFWENDRYFKNRDNLRRRLSLINRDIKRFDKCERRLIQTKGLLRDDTTVIVGRRRGGGHA